MAGVIAWVCRTPRRLIAVLVVPLLLILVGASLWSRSGVNGSGDASQAATAATGAQVPDATPFVAAAVKFVNVWGRLAPGQSPDQWHAAVRPLATADFANYLDQVDPESLENATVSSTPRVMALTARSALIAVPLSNGQTVELAVVTTDGESWLIDDVQPLAGN